MKMEKWWQHRKRKLKYSVSECFYGIGCQKYPSMGTKSYPNMADILLTTKGVEALLKWLNPKKGIGPDLISTRVLKQYSEHIAPVLKVLFQKSLETGEIPKDWRRANITLIYKKSNRQDPANYRPVSLTSVSYKTLEHIIFSHTMGHLDHYNILVHFQHGFRSKRSTDSANSDHWWPTKTSGWKQTQGHVHIRFFKALQQGSLLKTDGHAWTMESRGQTKSWVEHWLTFRVQQVVVDGETSREEAIKSGVPQGMVLGPLIFLIFINDTGLNISSTIRLFADDAQIYRYANIPPILLLSHLSSACYPTIRQIHQSRPLSINIGLYCTQTQSWTVSVPKRWS